MRRSRYALTRLEFALVMEVRFGVCCSSGIDHLLYMDSVSRVLFAVVFLHAQSDPQLSNPGQFSLYSSVMLVYLGGSVQIRSNLSPGYFGALSSPSFSTISVRASCSQQIRTLPDPE